MPTNPITSPSGKSVREKHGHTGTTTYKSWESMRQRCNNPRDASYRKYGARGITVCDRWISFLAFLEDMGERPLGKTLDRIDNERGYSPENCRWATVMEQCNNSRMNRRIEIAGRSMTLAEAARAHGMSYNLLQTRISVSGWPPEKAVHQKSRQAHRFL